MTEQHAVDTIRAGLHSSLRDRDRLIRRIEWIMLFFGLLLSVWLATQSNAAPQLILLAILYVIGINFSIPLGSAVISPTLPIVAVSSVLILSWPGALIVMLASFALAEFARPLWLPLWNNTPLLTLSRLDRAGRSIIHLLTLAAAHYAYLLAGGMSPLAPDEATVDLLTESLLPLLVLSVAYAGVYSVLTLIFWRLRQAGPGILSGSSLVYFPLVAVLTQPFALFGAITFAGVGLPGFVIFCVGVGAFAVIIWISWQRHYAVQQQLAQFAALNSAGILLRETLELQAVLDLAYERVNALLPSDTFYVALKDDQGGWSRLFSMRVDPVVDVDSAAAAFVPDDFARWVIEREAVLNVSQENIHFAGRHNLSLPEPIPDAWLGVPLITAERVTGVMVLQRFTDNQPFSEWSQEVLMAFAGQVSAAIQNARLYSEVVRLYNLTDEALAERVQQLQALLDSTHEGVLMLDRDGRIVLVNPVAAALLGGERQALLQKPLNPATAAAALGYEQSALADLLCRLTGEPYPQPGSHVYEIHLRRSAGGSDGERRFIERNEGPVLTEDAGLIGWLMVLRDITEEAERAEWRLNATRMIVHDLRNPITTLSSTLELIESRMAEGADAQVADLTQSAHRGIDDMLDMVDSLMDVTRMEAGQLVVDAEAMRLPALLERVVAHMRPLSLQKQIAVSTELVPDLPAVWGDEEILRRVLVNLLDNALKFTPAGGQVTVRLTADPPLSAGHSPGVLCVFEDTGPGIPEQSKAHVFDRFVRVNVGGAQVRGTGLGLTFCKLAIEAHGGRIWVEDAGQRGSRFLFTLPGVPPFDQ